MESPSSQSKMARSCHDLARLAAAVAAAGTITLSVETTGPDPLVDWVRLVTVGLPDFAIHHVDPLAVGGLDALADAIGHVHVVGHDLQRGLSFLAARFGVRPKSITDTAIAAKLLDGGLHAGSPSYFSIGSVLKTIDMTSAVWSSLDWRGRITSAHLEHAAQSVEQLLRLRDRLAVELEQHDLAAVCGLENELLPIVVDMSLAGIGVDVARWKELVRERQQRVVEMKKRLDVHGLAHPDDTELVLRALKRNGIAVEDTKIETLAAYLDRPAVRELIEYRRLSSFVHDQGNAILAGLIRHADGRVRATFDQLGCATGRFTASKPNLLGVQREAAVRSCFIPASGHVFIVADYSTIELRILAEQTGDEKLNDIFRDPAGDPHRRTASMMLGKASEDVTDDERGRAKAINFGLPYSMGPATFVSYALKNFNQTFSVAEAARFRDVYLHEYGGIKRWQDRVRAEMPSVVRTTSGRLRDFQDDTRDYPARLASEIQGTCADGIKLAMVLLGPILRGHGARLVLCVHDELVIEAPLAAAEQLVGIVREKMIDAMGVFVATGPIAVNVDLRPTWAKPSRGA